MYIYKSKVYNTMLVVSCGQNHGNAFKHITGHCIFINIGISILTIELVFKYLITFTHFINIDIKLITLTVIKGLCESLIPFYFS